MPIDLRITGNNIKMIYRGGLANGVLHCLAKTEFYCCLCWDLDHGARCGVAAIAAFCCLYKLPKPGTANSPFFLTSAVARAASESKRPFTSFFAIPLVSDKLLMISVCVIRAIVFG